MADDPGARAIGIVRALDAAGLLQSETVATASTSGIIGVLAEAGLLKAGAPATPPPPPTGAQVGDVVRVDNIRGVGKYTNPTSGEKYVRLAHDPVPGTTVIYYLDFPPNDEKWLPEIDKIIAAPKPVQVLAYVEITVVGTTEIYHGKLTSLAVESWWAL
jgi:hypothetical protein